MLHVKPPYKISLLPSPPLVPPLCSPPLLQGLSEPVGMTVTHGCLRAGRGQRCRVRGRRWRTRWWRSESPTSPSPRGGGSPSRMRRKRLVLGKGGTKGTLFRRGQRINGLKEYFNILGNMIFFVCFQYWDRRVDINIMFASVNVQNWSRGVDNLPW